MYENNDINNAELVLKKTHSNISFQIIEAAIIKSLLNLYKRDTYLIINKPEETEENLRTEKNSSDEEYKNYVSERSVVFRFGLYLQEELNKSDMLSWYDLDSDINRNLGMKKKIKCRPNGAFPDIIIHKRGSNDYNLLIIECKTWWNRTKENITDDITKIKDFMSEADGYSYKYGVIVIIKQNDAEIKRILTN